jgi:hypothetical protein
LKANVGEVAERLKAAVCFKKNPPALFALADFHGFSGVYLALSCAQMASFAGYSAPRVHQENGTLTSTLLGCSFLEKFEQALKPYSKGAPSYNAWLPVLSIDFTAGWSFGEPQRMRRTYQRVEAASWVESLPLSRL